MERDEIERLIASVGTWYHRMDLAGVETPGAFDMRPFVPHYHFPEDMSGLEVLDVGASNGFFSFLFESRGANVTAIDLPRYAEHDYPRWLVEQGIGQFSAEQLEQIDWNELHGGFEVAAKILGSKARRIATPIYEMPDHFGQDFDVVFCGSVLIHTRDPVLALESIARVMKQDALAIIATPVDMRHPEDRPCATFMGKPELVSWWLPNMAGLMQWCRVAGLNREVLPVSTFTVNEDAKTGIPDCIGVVHCRRFDFGTPR